MTFASAWVSRGCLAVLLFLLATAAWGAPRPSDAEPKTGKLWVYVGTYTGGASKGIYRAELDLASGRLSSAELAGEAVNPSFLAIYPDQRFLYAVGEVADFHGKKTGAVSAFAIEPRTGKLRLLNQQSSGGTGPCYVVVDRSGRHALAANYGGGSACVLPIEEGGRLGKATDVVQHHGHGVNKQRQEGPHCHSINLDAAYRYAFVADLGLDKVFIYRYDAARGKLTANDPAFAAVAPEAGPRHFAFHPSGRYAYVINELKSTITAFRYDAERGSLKELQTVSTLPRGFKGENTTAEVQVHPSGKFLYGSNRGHDSIAVFRIDPDTGRLTQAGRQARGIKVPRNFGIDPTGTFLVVANQDADSLVVFRIDTKTGELTATGSRVRVPKPVCVKMMRPLR